MSQPIESTAPAPSTDAAVRERYGEAARQQEQALCCPVDFDCGHGEPRDPRETKGEAYRETRKPGEPGCC